MANFGHAAVAVLVALRQFPCRCLFPCNARARTAGRSSVVLLPYRGLRGAGRAVRICMRCAGRDTITISTTPTTMSVLRTCRTLAKMWTCLALRAGAISRALLLRDRSGGTTPWYCGCGGVNGVRREEALVLIRGWTRTRTRMLVRTRMRTMMVTLGCGTERPTRIEIPYKVP
jgi:hypothetical protein